MQKRGGRTLFSAGDVVAFLECEHATTLALTDLETPLPHAEDDESIELIQQKGFAHEAGFLSSLKGKGLRVAEIASDGAPEALTAETATRASRAPRCASRASPMRKNTSWLGCSRMPSARPPP
jgi:uncharacterized protein